LEDARERVSALLGARTQGRDPDRLVFTSGGTEANNLALRGLARLDSARFPGHLVISSIEHACVEATAEHFLDRAWAVDTLPVDSDGALQTRRLADFIRDDTAVVSAMLVNHETGVVQPVGEAARIAADRGVPFHTDASQAVGKMPISFADLGVTTLGFAAHKFGGPVGIGGLLVKSGTEPAPILFGGNQQYGLRPGTESVALAVGMAAALEVCYTHMEALSAKVTALRDRFEGGLTRTFSEIVIHGAAAPRLPHTSNVGFKGCDAKILFTALDVAGIACSIGSACESGAAEVSTTLRAMRVPDVLLRGSLRFSLSARQDLEEIDEAVRRIGKVVDRLRRAAS
jgi:cysteine desulfurase